MIDPFGSQVEALYPSVKKKKPRIIPPERRKKVAQACDSCKKRKQKCNGLSPCSLCTAKNFNCEYTAIDRRVLKPSKKQLEERKKASNLNHVDSTLSPTNDGFRQAISPDSLQGEAKGSLLTPNYASPSSYTTDKINSQGQIPSGSSSQFIPSNNYQLQQQQQQQQQQQNNTILQDRLQQPLNPSFQHPVENVVYNFNYQPQAQPQPPSQHQQLQPQYTTNYQPNPYPIRQSLIPQQQFQDQLQQETQNTRQTRYPNYNGDPNVSPFVADQSQPQPTQPAPSIIQNTSITSLSSSNSDDQSNYRKKTPLPHSLQPSLSFAVDLHLQDDDDDSHNEVVTSTENGQNSRLLFDSLGNLCYIGESSPSSYLLQCRKVYQKVLGDNIFSQDPDRFTMVEKGTPVRNQINPSQLPERPYADYLLRTYLNNSNNIVYIIDDEVLKAHLNKVYTNPKEVSSKDICLLNLVFAIASVYAEVEISRNLFPFPVNSFIDPFTFHGSAVSILNSTDEDGHLWLVEAYLLLFFFHQFTGKRNTAWIKLGSAIRHAQALGLNRKFVNESFKDPSYVLHRRKLFRSLFIMDRLSSLYLGRSMTINNKDWDDIKSFDNIQDFQNRLLNICDLNGKILSEVYYNPSISLKIALKLAIELRQHSLQNPLTPENYSRPVDHRFFLPHICHLHGIILLSRPFFHFVVLQRLGLVKYDTTSKNAIHLNNFYQSCIKSSLLLIRIVEYVYHQNIHPFKPLSLISCTFHAGLIIGLLMLLKHQGIDDDVLKADPNIAEDDGKMLLNAMKLVIKLLAAYGKIDAPSKRYSLVLQKMLDSTRLESKIGKNSDMNGNNGNGMVDNSLNGLRYNNQENYQNILRFQDWLFPKFESIPERTNTASTSTSTAFDISPESNDEFLKDVAGLNNVNTSGPQFLDDFLFNVIDSNGLTNTVLPSSKSTIY